MLSKKRRRAPTNGNVPQRYDVLLLRGVRLMPAAFHRNLETRSVATIAVLALAASMLLAAHGAAAQAATGTVTGRVLWGPCIRALPAPIAPEAQTVTPAVPDAPEAQIGPGQRPLPA